MLTYLAIAMGGVLGCWGRYSMTNLLQTIFGRDFPFATMIVNVLGAFAMGFLFIETLERLTLSPPMRTGLLTGFLGGFTTFSTFSMEAFTLFQQGESGKALLYMAMSNLFGVFAAFGGAFIARSL